MKTVNLKTIIRKDIADMSAYVPVASIWDLGRRFNQKPEAVIKLDAGENQFGYSPQVRRALLTRGLFNFYPDPESKELRQALAQYTGAAVETIMVGSGSDELLDLLFRLILDEGDQVINSPPTFGMYAVATQLNKGVLVSVPRKTDFNLDLPGIKKVLNAKVKVIVVCSPNNPTGTVSSQTEIVDLLETGKLVIVDEAYFEFSGQTVVPLVEKYSNLIVLRTLSKWAGLAGLRLGYGIMDSFFVQQLLKIKPPYNVNLAASVAGVAALNDTVWREKTLGLIIKERQRLAQALSQIPSLIVYPSAANQLFIKVNQNFSQLKNFLDQKKIRVRYYEAYQAIRLSVGTPKQNDSVLAALQEFARPNWDSVIFDMDGVLVDVSQSYRQAIKLTVEYVLSKNFQVQKTVMPTEIEAMKQIPGFNNDWDLSFALIQLISQNIKKADFGQNISALSEQTKASQAYQEVKDIFQSYYLGAKLFLEIYQRPSPIISQPGLIFKETLLLDLTILKKLAKKYQLGIATSRPRFEALFALRNLQITPRIIQEKNIVALEDTPREKPFPDPLLVAQQKLSSWMPIYVGDSINDLLAAQQAEMPCIFVGKNKAADFQIKTTNQIKNILL